MKRSLKVALVGNPNSGKTSLFNLLTDNNNYTGNWAGVTVEIASGYYSFHNTNVAVIDLPGIYSLVASSDASSDETITTDFIESHPEVLLVNVIDAANLHKDLYLTLQLLETGKPVIVAVNFLNAAHNAGQAINISYLAEQLNCPVVAISEPTRSGILNLENLKNAIALEQPTTGLLKYILPEPISQILQSWRTLLPNLRGLRVFEGDTILSEKLVRLGIDVQNDLQTAQANIQTDLDISIAKIRRAKINNLIEIVSQPCTKLIPEKHKIANLIDNVVLNKYLGLPIFFLAMYLMFALDVRVGGFLQEYFDEYSAWLFVTLPVKLLNYLHAPTWLTLLLQGIGNGLNVTLTFAPVLAMMYLTLAFIEGVGYMARAAFIVDRIMRTFGLSGKSFVPMIVGFGCNVPAIMGTRTIVNYKERVLTIMMTPFMSCSARLAIYAIFVATFFPRSGHNIIFSLYVVGVGLAIITGLFLRKSILSAEKSSPSLMEFPAYHLPGFMAIVKQTWFRLQRFLTKAATMIIPMCILFNFVGSDKLEVIGKKITPIFAPIGIHEDNWQSTVGLLAGLVAKETLIGTLNALYDSNSSELSNELSSNAQSAIVNGFGSKHAAYAYLLFTLLYFPCISVVAAIAKELNLKWAIFSVFWSTGLAYLAATIYYQFAIGNIGSTLALIGTFGAILLLISYGFKNKVVIKPYRKLPTKVILN